MSVRRFFFFIIISGCVLYSTIIYKLGIGDIILALISMFSVFVFLNRVSLWRNFCSIVLFVLAFLSFPLITTFQVCYSQFDFNDYNTFAPFGNRIFFIITIATTLSVVCRGKKDKMETALITKPVKDRTIKFMIYLSFFLLFVAYVTGSLFMGDVSQRSKIILPFHLNGIINVYIVTFLPFLFAIFAENRLKTEGRVPRYILFFLFSFGLAGTFIRLSKSALVATLLPTALVMYVYYKPSIKKVLSLSAPVFALFLFLYPIVGLMRYQDSSMSFIDKVVSSYDESGEQYKYGEQDNVLVKSFNREFKNASTYMEHSSYLNNEDLFDFSKAPAIVAAGGGGSFVTYIIEGYSVDSGHSSGTSGTFDAALFGGYGFCYIFMILIALIASLSDRLKFQNYISFRVIMFFVVLSFFNFATISQFLDMSLLVQFVGYAIAVYLSVHMYSSSKKKRG